MLFITPQIIFLVCILAAVASLLFLKECKQFEDLLATVRGEVLMKIRAVSHRKEASFWGFSPFSHAVFSSGVSKAGNSRLKCTKHVMTSGCLAKFHRPLMLN